MGGNLPVPVVAKAQLFHLATEIVHIGFGGCLGVDAVLDGVGLRSQAKAIKAHGMEDIVPGHPEKPAINIRSSVPFWVAYVETTPRRIGEHVQNVLSFLRREVRVFCNPKSLVFLPVVLPFLFDLIEGIFTHSEILSQRGGVVNSYLGGDPNPAGPVFSGFYADYPQQDQGLKA
jgi:hypothetical protein